MILLPSVDDTVIVAEPTPVAVTTPVEETVATFVLELLHLTFLFVALVGVIVAVRVFVSPTVSVEERLLRLIELTMTLATLTVHVALTPLPSFADTVITAVPTDNALTSPEEETVATDVLELVHVTSFDVASLGEMVAVSFWDSLGPSEREGCDMDKL